MYFCVKHFVEMFFWHNVFWHNTLIVLALTPSDSDILVSLRLNPKMHLQIYCGNIFLKTINKYLLQLQRLLNVFHVAASKNFIVIFVCRR